MNEYNFSQRPKKYPNPHHTQSNSQKYSKGSSLNVINSDWGLDQVCVLSPAEHGEPRLLSSVYSRDLWTRPRLGFNMERLVTICMTRTVHDNTEIYDMRLSLLADLFL